MGGAQPLAVTMNEGVGLCDRGRRGRGPARRLEIGYVDRLTESTDEALAWARAAAAEGEPLSIALVGNAAEVEPELVRRGERFDVVTDQTSAHDALAGYVPAEISLADATALRDGPAGRLRQPDPCARWPTTSGRCSPSRRPARSSSTTATTSGRRPRTAGVADAFDYPGFVPAFIRPLFCEGKGPFRWVALSGDPADIQRTDRGDPGALPRRRAAAPLDRDGRGQGAVPGPAGPHLLAGLRRAGPGRRWRSTSWSARGEVGAPIVIGRDHLDAGSVASPNRETEAMRDGSDAIADWPLLNALVNTAAGATWVSIHHGGGTGIGYSQHAGMVVVADGTDLAARKLERVLTTDPGMGVIRHADAGYERAIEVARERGVRIPMLEER